MSTGPPTHVRVGISVFVQHPKSPIHSKPVFLVGLRRGSHGAGTWGLPGGHLELGESFEECAKREVWEETGFTVKNLHYLTATNDVFPVQDKSKHYVTIFMLAQVALDDDDEQKQHSQQSELKATLKEPEKCERWEWFSWEEIASWSSQEHQGDETNSNHRPFLPLRSLVEQRPGFQPRACPNFDWH